MRDHLNVVVCELALRPKIINAFKLAAVFLTPQTSPKDRLQGVYGNTVDVYYVVGTRFPRENREWLKDVLTRSTSTEFIRISERRL